MSIYIGSPEDELKKARISIPAILFGSGLTKKQFIICCYLLFLARDGKVWNITANKISEALGFSPTAVLRHLSILRGRGYIGFQEGSSTMGKYGVITIDMHSII